MSEAVEIWRAMKEHRRETRIDALVTAQQEWPDFLGAAQDGGYEIHIMSEHHWNIHKNSRCVAQYWPSANKWQTIRTGKIKHGSRDEIRRAMRDGRL